jgi:thiol-disulfide isomerase/thioredoxin
MKPLVEGLEKEYGEKIEFRKFNVESDQAGVKLANELGVQYVPTFLFVNTNGVISKQVVGSQTEEQMRALLDGLQ